MAQFVRPIADVDAGSWDDSSVGDNDGVHWDELVADDDSKTESDAVSNNVNTTDLDVEGTNSGITDPAVSTGHIIRVVWNSSATDDMTGHAELWQGVPDTGSLIAEATVELVDTTEITTTHTLTAGEADAITDYNDLHFALWGRGTGGGPARTLQVDLLELEIPDAGGDAQATLTAINAAVTLTATTQTASATANATAINVPANLTTVATTTSNTATLTAVNAIVNLTTVDAQGNGSRTLTAINAVVTIDQPTVTSVTVATLTAITATVTIPPFPDRDIIPAPITTTATLPAVAASAGEATANLTTIQAK